MSNLIEFLESAGCGHGPSFEGHLPDGLAADVLGAVVARDAAALARAAGIGPVHACYVTAPDNDPVPAESPDELPDDPEQQDSEAA